MPNGSSGESTDHRGGMEQFEREFLAIAYGADNLAQREQGYRILLDDTLPAPVPRDFASWAEVVPALEALDSAVPGLNPHITTYIQGILRAFHTFARVRAGARLSYLQQVRSYLELADVWVEERELAPLRERIGELLADLGLPADLPRGLRAWEARRHVLPGQVKAVAEPLVTAAREAAIARGVPVPHGVEVEFVVRATPYYAYAHYHRGFRGIVELSSDIGWTVEAIRHSVCHEAFPGHVAQAAARESAIARGDWGSPVLPVLANTPTSPVVEGVAEHGAEILGWVTSIDEQLYSAFNALSFGVLTNAAVLRHEHGQPRERVIEFIVTQASVSREWASYQYGFLTDPLWHTTIPEYWHGAKLVRGARQQFQGRERDLFQALFSRRQTVSTLYQLLADDAGSSPS